MVERQMLIFCWENEVFRKIYFISESQLYMILRPYIKCNFSCKCIADQAFVISRTLFGFTHFHVENLSDIQSRIFNTIFSRGLPQRIIKKYGLSTHATGKFRKHFSIWRARVQLEPITPSLGLSLFYGVKYARILSTFNGYLLDNIQW